MAKKQKSESLVVQQIVIQAPQRRTYDVGDWRSALKSADSGRTKPLYDLFDDILIDGVLSDAIEKRIGAVLNADLNFVTSDGKEDGQIADLIESSAWETLLRTIMNQRIFGRSACEFSFADGFKVTPIKAKYIDLKNQVILLNDIGDKVASYQDHPLILTLGELYDYGLLLKAAPYAIYKRGGFGDYAQWIELFGMPQRIGKYNTYDPRSRQLLEEAFEKAGSAPYLVIPKEADIETKEGPVGSGTSYNEFREANNEEMLITILGQTLTTVQGERGARSLGEVHLEVEASKHASDIRFVQRVLNEQVRPILERRGFNLTGGRFVFPKEAEPLSVNELVELSALIEIPASYIHEKYSIPQAKNGEQIARKQSTEVIEVQKNAGSSQQEEIKNGDGRNFLNRLWDFFVVAPQVGAVTGTIRMKDAKTLDERLIARTPNTTGFDTELFEYLSNDLIKAFRIGLEQPIKNTGIDIQYSLQDDAMKTAMEMNLFRFSAAKTLAEIQDLNQIFRDSKSYSEFEKRAKIVCEKFNKTWQRTEYDTALLAAESASNYQRLIQKAKIYPYWQYRTIRDGRVRLSHKKLDGIVLPVGDPRWDKIFPPNDWNCRCRIKPLLKSEFSGSVSDMRKRVDEWMESDEWSRAVANGWGSNRAKQGLVYNENQFYTNILTKRNQGILNKLNHTDYGLPTIEECLKKATQEMPIYEGTAQEWYKNHNILTDYVGRQIEMPKEVFITHTTKKSYIEQGRITLLNSIGEVLKTPNEIWINDYNRDLDNVIFVKYYHGKMIVVTCRSTKLEYSISTWFEVFVNAKTRHQYRRGLLVKK